MMFINNDIMFSICQLAEFQWKMYSEFLKLTGSQEEAERQTKIYMGAFMAAGKDSNKD